jgi:hypothetical protein
VEDVKSDGTALHAGLALERRRSPRRRALKRATVVFRRGYCTMGCHILDISETGALLKPADIFLCPSEFVLKRTLAHRTTARLSGGKARWWAYTSCDVVPYGYLGGVAITRTPRKATS